MLNPTKSNMVMFNPAKSNTIMPNPTNSTVVILNPAKVTSWATTIKYQVTKYYFIIMTTLSSKINKNIKFIS